MPLAPRRALPKLSGASSAETGSESTHLVRAGDARVGRFRTFRDRRRALESERNLEAS
jgi:hypothetical protein